MSRIRVGLTILTLILSSPLYAVAIPVASIQALPDADRTLLPESFPVYCTRDSVMSHPVPDSKQKFLPTNNKYTQNPGCYIACYSPNQTGSVYPIDGKGFVVGQIRVAGSYNNTTCSPEGYENEDLTKENTFIQLCAATFKTCKNGACFADGETGGWFQSGSSS